MKKFFVILSVILLIALTVVPVSAASVIKGEQADYLTLTDPQYFDIRFPLNFEEFPSFIVCDAAEAFPGQTGIAFIVPSTYIRLSGDELGIVKSSTYSVYDPLTGLWGPFAQVPADGVLFYLQVNDTVVCSADAEFVPAGYKFDRLASFIRTNVSTGVVDVVADFGSFIPRALGALVGIFYVDGALTLLGILALAALAVSFAFLVLYLVVRFLAFRG